MKKATIVGIAVVVLVLAFVYLVKTSDPKMKYIASDIEKDHSRFAPGNSVDIDMAMKLITHDPPHMLNPPGAMPTLLLYPPSADDLARLSGA
jgi:hypothetical protein